MNKKSVFVFSFLFLILSAVGYAEEFQCEILSVEGDATVLGPDGSEKKIKEGDLIKKGSKIETNQYSSLNIAFDKDWQNVLNMELQSQIQIESVAPAKVSLEKGGVFAKLKKLPKDSSFEVETPTALAAVRGTEYRTTFVEGETKVFNASSSQVSVFGLDASGNPSGEPVILTQSQKTGVGKSGESPHPAELMSSDDSKIAEELKSGIEEKIKVAEDSGRVGKIQDILAIEQALMAKGPAQEAESRVVDTRRRPFKKA